MIIKEIDANDFLVKSKLPAADYVCNSYVGCTHKCIYCYARFMKRFTGHLEEWGEFLDIKNINNYKLPKDIKGKYIFISSVTDPYNAYEEKYKKTRYALELLRNTDCNIGILTKSKLVLRDIDIIKNMSNVEVGLSINSLDDEFRKLIEPKASSVNDRINALKELKEANIKTYLFMSPMFPILTDFKKIIEKTKDYVDYYCFENLNLRGDYKNSVLNLIKDKYSNLYSVYYDIYVNGNNSYWDNLEKEIAKYCNDNHVNYKNYFHHNKIRKD